MQYLRDSGYPPGTVCLAAPAQPRFYEFTDSMDHLQVPYGTAYIKHRGCDIAFNFNRCVEGMTGDWAWFVGDDHQFQPDILFRLLAYDVDVVVPISPTKVAPFAPCMIHGPTDGRIWDDNMPLYTWDEVSGEGLYELPRGDFIGQAGMLVKKHVLDEIGKPWFKTGMFNRGRLQEDIYFCHELQQKGYTVWVDRDIIFDHWFHVGVTARKHEGLYAPALKTGLMTLVLPDCKPVRDLHVGNGNRPAPKWVHRDVSE